MNTNSTLFMLAADQVRPGTCDVCSKPSPAIRFYDSSSGIMFGDCCLNWTVKLATMGIRPPSRQECREFEKAGR